MSDILYLERRWVMDTFGCYLEYDPSCQKLISTRFLPQRFPNLFTLAPMPEKLPCRTMRLRLAGSLPESLPPIAFFPANGGAVCLQNLETKLFLSSFPACEETSFQAGQPKQWEHFYLLTQEMITGLSLITDPEMADLYVEGQKVPAMHFLKNPEERTNFAEIDDIEIKIFENLPEIAKLAHSTPYEKITLSCSPYGAGEKFPLEVIPKTRLHLTSFPQD